MKKSFFLKIFFVLILSSCTNFIREGDTAYLKEDWDSAVQNYSQALNNTSDPQEILYINNRLNESKMNGAKYHLSSAIKSKNDGDIEAAYKHAVMADGYAPSKESRKVVDELKMPERNRLIELGEKALKNESWDEAISLLEQANKIDNTAKADALISQAKKVKAEAYQNKFNTEYQDAITHLTKREWDAARQSYDQAHIYGSTDRSRKEAEFVAIMQESEKYANQAFGNTYYSNKAEEMFGKALAYGIDQQYVTERLRDMELHNYKLIVHGAVVLPTKPISDMPWDGLGSQKNSSKNLLSELGSFVTTGGVVSAGLVTEVMGIANTGIAAPDCYVEVHAGNQIFGGKQTTNQNDYQPNWELGIHFYSISRNDDQIVSIVVRDADETDDDNVGTYQFKLSDIIKKGGVQQIALFNDKGELRADGLLVITLSATRM